MKRPGEIDATEAAHSLALKVPDTYWDYWRWFLANNRKKDRAVAHRIPYRKERSRVYYRVDDLNAFAAKEKHRRTAVKAVAELPERSYVSKAQDFKWTIAQRAEGGAPAVRLKVTGFTIGFSLTAAEAREMAEQLVRFAARVEHSERK